MRNTNITFYFFSVAKTSVFFYLSVSVLSLFDSFQVVSDMLNILFFFILYVRRTRKHLKIKRFESQT